LWITEKGKQQLLTVTVETEQPPETKHKSPSKQERDAERLKRFFEETQTTDTDDDPHVREYITKERRFLEATAYHDNVPGSPGRGDVVATFDSKGLDVTEGVVMRNSKRRHVDPQLKKLS
jgi:hypothetical protein